MLRSPSTNEINIIKYELDIKYREREAEVAEETA